MVESGGIALTVASWCVCWYTVSTPDWCIYTCKHTNLASTLQPYLANPIKSNPIDRYRLSIQSKIDKLHRSFLDILSIYRLFINYLSIITVPTTCSRPSIEMVGFITVPTTCSRPSIEMVGFSYLLLCRLLVVGPVLKWLALFNTVPTTCSRPSIEMVGFIYYCADYL